MTWITPFDCMTLGIVTSALSPLASITQRCRRALEREGLALDGLQHRLAAAVADHRVDLGFGQPAGHDVIGEDRASACPCSRA